MTPIETPDSPSLSSTAGDSASLRSDAPVPAPETPSLRSEARTAASPTPESSRRFGLAFAFIGLAVVVAGVIAYFVVASPKHGAPDHADIQPTDNQQTASTPTASAGTATTPAILPIPALAESAASLVASVPLDAQSAAQFTGEWTGKSHVASITVGGMTVFLDDNPRIAFAGTNGEFRSDRTLAVTPAGIGAQVLLLQVKSPQRLPEPQPESVDPEPVYWIALARASAGDPDNASSANLDMAVFLKANRPTMDLTIDKMCTEQMQDAQCRTFDFFREAAR